MRVFGSVCFESLSIFEFASVCVCSVCIQLYIFLYICLHSRLSVGSAKLGRLKDFNHTFQGARNYYLYNIHNNAKKNT